MSVVEERYEKWVNSPNLDESYKEVLESMNSGSSQEFSCPTSYLKTPCHGAMCLIVKL